jgi:peptidyl-prolyl cis-trans isomerase C
MDIQLPEITVNSVTIPQDKLGQELQNHPADDLQQALLQSARTLILKELLIQEANSKGISSDNDSAKIDKLIAENVEQIKADTDTCRRYYQANPERFRSAPLMAARHILLPVTADDVDGRIEKKELAEKLITMLQQGYDFAALAKEYSACPSKELGGSLGQISSGQTVPEFERHLFNLPEGLAVHPVETRYGFHVVEIEKKIDGEILPFEHAEERIEIYLKERNYRQNLSHYLHELAEKAEIVGFDLETLQ